MTRAQLFALLCGGVVLLSGCGGGDGGPSGPNFMISPAEPDGGSDMESGTVGGGSSRGAGDRGEHRCDVRDDGP